MIVDSDAAYLVLLNAKSRITGYYCLGSEYVPGISSDAFRRTPNAPILIEYKTLKYVVASAVEAKASGLYHNAQTILPIIILLKALDHPQQPTLIKSDNSTAVDFVKRNIYQKNQNTEVCVSGG